jgi:hypothetical protein
LRRGRLTRDVAQSDDRPRQQSPGAGDCVQGRFDSGVGASDGGVQPAQVKQPSPVPICKSKKAVVLQV